MKRKPVKIAVKPNGGLVRMPAHLKGGFMPAEGMMVPDDAYWHRRLRGKDVVRISESALKKTKAEAPVEALVEAPIKGKGK
jgi:hypothetical protein